MGYYISEKGKDALLRYQYRGRDLSLVYKYLLTPMNNVLIEFIPLWVAPNVVTLCGVLSTMSSYVVLMLYCPLLEGHIPAWVLVFDALANFTYQTLDNLDGKQARRTGSSSPLGLLFDHGCDAFNTTVGALNHAAIMQTGGTWKALALWQVVSLPFFFTTLEELYTGELLLPVVNGPTEGILALCALKLWTVWVGVEWWVAPNSLVPSLPNNTVLLVPMLCLSNLYTLVNFYTIYHTPHRRVGFHVVLAQVLPYVSMQALAVLWVLHAPGLMLAYPRTLMWTAGLLFAKMAMHLMLAHLTGQAFSPVRRTFLAVTACALLVGYLTWVQGVSPDSKVHVYILLGIWALSVMSYSHFVYYVIQECCEILKIPCFRIKTAKSD